METVIKVELESTSNENVQAPSAEAPELKSNVDSRSSFDEAKARAVAAFSQSGSSVRSSFVAALREFEKAKNRFAIAKSERDTAWNALPKEVQESLARSIRENAADSKIPSSDLNATNVPFRKIVDATRAQRNLAPIREDYYQKRSKCRALLLDQILSTCAGYLTGSAPFPASEFESKADVLIDLRLCRSIGDAMEKAQASWNDSRARVVANPFENELKAQGKSPSFWRKRRMFREFKKSPDWKVYANSFSTILGALAVSGFVVGALWVAIIKWNLVYFLKFESIFPYKSDAFKALYAVTPFVWLGLAWLYRDVVASRLQFRAYLRKIRKFRKEVKKAKDE